MIKSVNSKDSLPLSANEGDVVTVTEGMYTRNYVWRNGIWHHELDYVCPVNANDLYNEPNV